MAGTESDQGSCNNWMESRNTGWQSVDGLHRLHEYAEQQKKPFRVEAKAIEGLFPLMMG